MQAIPRCFVAIYIAYACCTVRADAPSATTRPTTQRAKYTAPRATTAPTIDGRLDDAAWEAALWTTPFIDLAGRADHPPRLATQCKMLWDDDCLYIAAEMAEPDVWSTILQHDGSLFHEDAFELFIDPDGDGQDYCEIQVNPLNTIWDLKMSRPYREKGKADSSWELVRLRSATRVDGTLNDASDCDRGWTIELAIPWDALASLSAEKPLHPESLDQFRLNLVRVDWPEGAPGGVAKSSKLQPNYWAWSSAGETNAHLPGTWGKVEFQKQPAGKAAD